MLKKIITFWAWLHIIIGCITFMISVIYLPNEIFFKVVFSDILLIAIGITLLKYKDKVYNHIMKRINYLKN